MTLSLADPPDLSLWGLHCFCLGARQTPHRAIAADNNGQILYLARNGVTRAELASAGVQCLDSQIALLQLLGVLSVNGATLRTVFPTLGFQTMEILRQRSKRRAVSIVHGLRPATRKVAELLAASDFSAHQYAVVFGHGLDSLMWEKLRRAHELPCTGLSVGKPLWNGTFWAVSPKRSGVAGTNENIRGPQTLVTVWTDSTAEELQALSTSWERGIWSEPMPVISTRNGDSLHLACTHIAQLAAESRAALVAELHSDNVGEL
jgi:hypothetical protein